MVKAVAVLSSSAGVSGTIYFTQEEDGNFEIASDINMGCVIHMSGCV